MKIIYKKLLLLALLLIAAFPTQAWVYPEHRIIFLKAIQKLSAERRAMLDRIWGEAILKDRARLTDVVIEPNQGVHPGRLDYASWAAIAGDHSCSPEDMMNVILKSDWILRVADIAAQLQVDISDSRTASKHVNAIRNSDIRLQRADPDYATRASGNNAHFLLSRPGAHTTADEYFNSCLKEGVEINALSTYVWFHSSAVYKAARYANENIPAELKSALILGALADEAFAIHFLEDVFAAGHTAGTWGRAAIRKGTHDYYNEQGLEVVTWSGERLILMGDAYIRDTDVEYASTPVSVSLEQVLKAAAGELTLQYANEVTSSVNGAGAFNVCAAKVVATRNIKGHMDDDEIKYYLRDILMRTPVPGLATGLGEVPRFRSEMGAFFGVSSAAYLSSISGGFGKMQTERGLLGGIDLHARFGLGLDGVLNEAGDGLFFVQVGVRQDASSSNQYGPIDSQARAGSLTAAIPGRAAYDIRVRMPFWLIPGDLIIAAPILMLTSPNTLARMGVTAVNGGVIPWQTGIHTPIGRFQFVAGREIGISVYGSGWLKPDASFIPTDDVGGAMLVSYTSTKFDFPILEYQPTRSFSRNQSSSLIIQLTTGFDVPHNVTSLDPVLPAPELQVVRYVALRLVFDWRKYL